MWSNKDSIAIHFTGIRPWKANTGSYIDFTAKPVKHQMLYSPLRFTLLLLTYESSSYTSLERPKSEIFIFLPSATRTFRAARSLWTSWAARDANLASPPGFMSQKHHWLNSPDTETYFFVFFHAFLFLILGPAAAMTRFTYVSCIVPSSQPGTACLWRSAMQMRSGPPWWVLGHLGSLGSWSSGWRPCPCSSVQLSDSPAGSCEVNHTWRIPRSDTMDLFKEMQALTP